MLLTIGLNLVPFNVINKYSLSAYITPTIIGVVSFVDVRRTDWSTMDNYYKIVIGTILALNGVLLFVNILGISPFKIFLVSLSSALILITAQLFKSTLRFGKIIT